jgi:hypothetical protein
MLLSRWNARTGNVKRPRIADFIVHSLALAMGALVLAIWSAYRRGRVSGLATSREIQCRRG